MILLALHHCFMLGELAQPGMASHRFSDLTQTWNKVLECCAKSLCFGKVRFNVLECAGGG
jgi:hypothetical protein